MIESIGHDLIALYKFQLENGAPATGLTDITVDVIKDTGIILQDQTGVTEVAFGYYKYTLPAANVTTPGIYVAIAQSDTSGLMSSVLDAGWIVDPSWIAAIQNSVADIWEVQLPGAYTVGQAGNILGSVNTSGITYATNFNVRSVHKVVYKGYDHLYSRNTGLTWQDPLWPALSGVSTVVSLKITPRFVTNPTTTTYTGTLLNAGSANQLVYIDLTNAQTSALTVGKNNYEYVLQAVTGTVKDCLKTGFITVGDGPIE